MFQYDVLTACHYVSLLNDNEYWKTELQFQIEDTTGEGLSYNSESIAQAIKVCQGILEREAISMEDAFQVVSENVTQRWEVKREGVLPELNRKSLLRIFQNAIQCLLGECPPRYQRDNSWGILSCVTGIDYRRHIYDYGIELYLRLLMPTWTPSCDFKAFTKGLSWQGSQLQGYSECMEGPLMFHAVVDGLSPGRRDTLTQDFINKVAARHFAF